jgi:drug/metabolite transporter (DMT)-like permease
LVTASAVAWSTTGLFTRILTLDTATMLVWRGLFGAAGLVVVLLALEGPRGMSAFRRLGAAGLIYALVSAAGMLCFIAALGVTTVAHVAIIYAIAPFLAAALGWYILHDAPGRTATIAAAIAFAGAIYMIGLGREGTFSGAVLAFGMTLAMAILMVMGRKYPAIPTLPAAILSALLSALAALPFAQGTIPAAPDLAILAAFGLVNSALGIALFLMGSRHIKPIETALIGALDAPLAPLWVWIIFAEAPSDQTLIGGTIVFAAVVWHIIMSTRTHHIADHHPPVTGTSHTGTNQTGTNR